MNTKKALQSRKEKIDSYLKFAVLHEELQLVSH